MNLSVMEIFSLVTWIQLLLLAFVLIAYKKGKRISNLLLAGFLFSNSVLPAQHFIIRFNAVPFALEPYVQIFGSAAYSLLMPFLFLYILSLCDNSFKLKPVHLLHSITYVFIVAFSLITFYLTQNAQTGTFFHLNGDNFRIIIFYLLIHIQVATYLLIIFKTLRDYRQGLKEFYSFTEKIDLSWLMILLIGFTAMWLINLTQWLTRIIGIDLSNANNTLTTIAVIINLLFTLIVTYISIVKSEYISGIAIPRRYANSPLTLSDCKDIVQKLINVMDKEKIYLKPSLTVEDLSARKEIPARHISQSIRIILQCNFYEFVNKYRIEEVKRRLADESSQHLSLVAIAYGSGFSSKSVFNSAFKKYVGKTPKEFKNALINQQNEIN